MIGRLESRSSNENTSMHFRSRPRENRKAVSVAAVTAAVGKIVTIKFTHKTPKQATEAPRLV